ncbi:MAG: 6,7-dimethyl-8-ribityllumazine synthase, partial [Cyanobacteria bacterium P01_E01_bin.34]
VVRGQTPHFDYVAGEVSKGIAAIGLQTGVPVIYGILTTDTMQQAIERAGVKSNLGWSYGMDAIEMATLLSQIQLGGPSNGKAADGSASLPSTSTPFIQPAES